MMMISNKLVLSNKIEIVQDQNIYDFISQFQLLTNKIICLINKSKLHLYEDEDNDFPRNVKLSHKDHSNDSITIYHFTEIDTKDNYCLFGKKFAQRFLSSVTKKSESLCKFNYIRSSIVNNPSTNNCLIKIIDNSETIIIDDNIKIIFTNYKPQLQIQTITD